MFHLSISNALLDGNRKQLSSESLSHNSRPFHSQHDSGSTNWYRSRSDQPLFIPPKPLDRALTLGHLFVHQNTLDQSGRIWLYGLNGWMNVTDQYTHDEIIPHPDSTTYPNRVLHLQERDGSPSWVLLGTKKRYLKSKGQE